MGTPIQLLNATGCMIERCTIRHCGQAANSKGSQGGVGGLVFLAAHTKTKVDDILVKHLRPYRISLLAPLVVIYAGAALYASIQAAVQKISAGPGRIHLKFGAGGLVEQGVLVQVRIGGEPLGR